jgi:hypothetical protein
MGEPTAEQYRARVNEYLVRFGSERDIALAPLSEDGRSCIQRGSAVVWIHVLPAQGVLLLLAKVMPVPEAGREALYRRLLELSYVATGDAAFAIDAATDSVYVRALRQLDGLDYDEFEDLLHTVASVADEWDDQLRHEFGG